MSEKDDLAALKVGDQFWAVSSSCTPYEVTSIRHSPGAQYHLWAVITARELMEASRPFDQMPLIAVSRHESEITLHRRVR